MKKVAFITGASRGIGFATARKFSEKGWEVAGFYNIAPGPKVKNCKYYQLDLSNSKETEKAFGKAFRDFKRIDCLVNCAGIFGYKNLKDYDEKLMDQVIAVNEKGTYLCTKLILDKMTQGSIVNISSTAAQIGSSDPVYAGTKSAIFGFTKSMAKALAPNVRVNCVSPGVTESNMTKSMNPERLTQLIDMTLLKRIALPEDIANGIYFLASDEANHITGICLDISGGYVLR